MKRGFTLVEMLIVVVVLVTLMTITFRLSTVGSDQEARATTISRMQRLENCLSGYYAAYGSYPPVKLHGSRNIYLKTNGNGVQDESGQEGKDLWGWKEINEDNEYTAWNQVRAACCAQPLAAAFPFEYSESLGKGVYEKAVLKLSEKCKKMAQSGKSDYKAYWYPPEVKEKFMAGFDDLVTKNSSRHTNEGELDWRNIQLFKFGLMSYLLPRYLVMMKSYKDFYRNKYEQWCGNNTLPNDALTGDAFNDWNEVKEYTVNGEKMASDYARVANIPSQSVCARWLPNLAGICACHNTKVMGIEISGGGAFSLSAGPANPPLWVFSSQSGSYGNQYLLDGVTVRDGWESEFYYYSPPPYQQYELWSAGPNGRTFPPWIDRASMSADANRCIGKWIEDDIVRLSH